jgi:hypothetical protein
MDGITFSEVEVKKLILALAGSKAPVEESPVHEADPKDSEEDKAEDKPGESAGKPFGKDAESTKDMLKRKLEEKNA